MASAWAFYSCNKIDNLCTVIPDSKARHKEAPDIQGHRFKTPGRARTAVLGSENILQSLHQMEKS